MIWPPGRRVVVTGHRDARSPVIRDRLTTFLSRIADRSPVCAVSGMAVGADTAFAEAAVHLGIPLVAAIPTDNHGVKWPAHVRSRYDVLIQQAALVVPVWEDPAYHESSIFARFIARDRWMIDHADDGIVVAVWDGRKHGGTAATVRMAISKGLRLVILDPASGEFRVGHQPNLVSSQPDVLDIFGD